MKQRKGTHLKLTIPPHIRGVLNIFHQNGYEAYLVGGCVRDLLLGRTPLDFDITTNASTDGMQRMFAKTVPTGERHGTITILTEGGPIEATTYRVDGAYQNHRTPKQVTFSKNLYEDVRRRDFTINALCYNEEEGLLDLCGGLLDLSEKRIRCIGEPEKRFSEDALRLLRAARFAITLGFTIEEQTRQAVLQQAHLLSAISRERVQGELVKILLCDAPQQISLLSSLGLADAIGLFEAVSRNGALLKGTVGFSLPKEDILCLRLGVLFWQISGQPLKSLRFSNALVKRVTAIQASAGMGVPSTKEALKRILNHLNEHLAVQDEAAVFTLGLMLQSAIAGTSIKEALALLSHVQEKRECYLKKDLAICGADLVMQGLSGPQIGQKLQEALDIVLAHPEKNTREYFILNIL